MSIDTISNFLTIIRNGLMVRKRSVSLSSSKVKAKLASVLKDEGYIRDFKITNEEGNKTSLTIFLKYVDGRPVIHELKRVSKPSRRCYERRNNLTSVVGGLGIAIITTSSGIITDRHARKLGIGGEVICHIW